MKQSVRNFKQKIPTMRKLLTGILDTEKRYTTETALAMPEAGYSYKPADSVWEFRELIHHMVYSIDWMNASYLEGRKTDWNPGIVTGNKDEIVIEELKNCGKICISLSV